MLAIGARDRRPGRAIGHVAATSTAHRSTASSSVAIGTSSGAISTFTVILMLPPLYPTPPDQLTVAGQRRWGRGAGCCAAAAAAAASEACRPEMGWQGWVKAVLVSSARASLLRFCSRFQELHCLSITQALSVC